MKIFFGAMIMVFLSSSIFAVTPQHVPVVHVVVSNRTDFPWWNREDILYISGVITTETGSKYSLKFEKIDPGFDAKFERLTHPFHTIAGVEVNFIIWSARDVKYFRVAQCKKSTSIYLPEGGKVSIVATGYRKSQKGGAVYKLACTIISKNGKIIVPCHLVK